MAPPQASEWRWLHCWGSWFCCLEQTVLGGLFVSFIKEQFLEVQTKNDKGGNKNAQWKRTILKSTKETSKPQAASAMQAEL